MRRTVTFIILLGAALFVACQSAPQSESDWRTELEHARAERNAKLSSENPASRFGLVHREYLGDRKEITFGTDSEAGIRLTGDDIAPIHARFDTSTDPPRVHEVHPDWKESGDTKLFSVTELTESSAFSVGRYYVSFRPNAPVHGDALEIFDTAEPAVVEFKGIDFYPADPKWRVTATVVPDPEPEQIVLVDSHGQDRPYWIYGDLNFTLEGKDLTLKLYTDTLDMEEIRESGFQLMFTDLTTGEETYDAGRYLYVKEKAAGGIVVDLNRAFNPPCNFSPVYTCPFPRKENHLDVAIRAGERKYTGTIATPLVETTHN